MATSHFIPLRVIWSASMATVELLRALHAVHKFHDNFSETQIK